MGDNFVAEIRIFPFNFAPKGWATCDGQLMSISQNTALFSLLGTTYGGDGESTFGLPNLQGSVPMHTGGGSGPGLSVHILGESSGEQNVTLLTTEMPNHNHTSYAAGAGGARGGTTTPANNFLGNGVVGTDKIYAAPDVNNPVLMSPQGLSTAGSSFPHNNMQPYLCLNFCIAMQGVFPPRS